MNNSILPFEKIDKTDVSLVGGKGASLGEMTRVGIPVPPGFVITTKVYEKFEKKKIPKDIEQEILQAFDILQTERVAVRSSATAEDSSSASWAGQLESYLNVTRAELRGAVKKCWDSINSTRVKAYAKEQKVTSLKVAVVVQKMVNSDVSGVMFTVNPVTNNHDEIMIEAGYGLGELIVQGMITPDSYIVDKKTEKIKNSTLGSQKIMLTYENKSNQEVPVPSKLQNTQTLSEKQIKALAILGKQIETHYHFPQDIEWAIENGQIYIVQSRPITTLFKHSELPEFFSHCVKTIARPSTLQRDELFRYISNAILPIEMVSLPLERNVRAYYLEKENCARLYELCLVCVATPAKLAKHLRTYKYLLMKIEKLKKSMQENPRTYKVIFKNYFQFLDEMSLYLYLPVAIDKILEPKFKSEIVKKYPNTVDEILENIGKPTKLHEYQKYRIALCKLVPKYKKNPSECSKQINTLVDEYGSINEYSFIENLISAQDIVQELDKLTEDMAKKEVKEIQNSLEQNTSYKSQLEQLIPDKSLLNKALIMKEYSWLRNDRLDRLKEVQVSMRFVYKQLAQSFAKKDKNPWTIRHVVHLLNEEIMDFITTDRLPDFKDAKNRLTMPYLYYFTNGKAVVSIDPAIVSKATQILIKTEKPTVGSLISSGVSAYKGVVKGKVVKIYTEKDMRRVVPGSIIVARVVMPKYTRAIKSAVGIITSEGGITSHAAIIARELRKPCIVGSQNCMEVLKEGELILLDGANQVVAYCS